MKANKTLMAALAVGGLLALSPMLRAADTNAPAAGTPPPAGAPGMRGGGRMMGPDIDQVAKNLNLTDDQKAKVKTILDDRQQKMRQLMQDMRDGKVQRSDMRTKMQTIRDDTDKQLKDAGLTQEQVDKFNEMTGPRQRRNAPATDNAKPATEKPAAGDKAQQ